MSGFTASTREEIFAHYGRSLISRYTSTLGNGTAPQQRASKEVDAPQQRASKEEDAPQPLASKEVDAPQQRASKEEDAPRPLASKEVDSTRKDIYGDYGRSLISQYTGTLGDRTVPQPLASKEVDAPQQRASKEEDAPQPLASKEEDAPQPLASKEVDAPQPLASKEVDAPQPLASKEGDAPQPRANKEGDVVGILGAGVGGLYTAIMFESLGINFEIIEASDRVGGRLFTHKFEEGGEYDYYDVGAMRYPLPKMKDGKYEPGVMQRLGNLFNYLGMQDKLIPYYFTSDKSPGFQLFNGVRARITAPGNVPPNFNAPSLGISDTLIELGVSQIVDDVIGPFARMLYNDLRNHTRSGWEVMMRNDAYSTRAYMAFKYIPSARFGLEPEHLKTRVINWCETFDKSTGWYDRALSETVLEAIAFGEAGDGAVDWKCIKGGSHVLPDTMAAFLEKKVGNRLIKNATVTAIGLEADDYESPMIVTAGGKEHKYSHVVSTIPLPVLRTIDLSKSNLDILQSNALRQLQYGPSIKVGILFSETWWTTGADMDGVPFNIVGGQSYTDLPIRTVVYPSYGAYTDRPSKTLIASYCWTNDAERMGSLIGTGQQRYDDQLEHLVLSNLAAVHNVTYEYLKTRLVEIHSWDWNHFPLTMGAFAFFGPGNFEDMYTSLNRPAANDKLHFAGEALSVRHAWVEGALDSAWRAVHNYLFYTDPLKLTKFYKLWGKNAEWFEERDASDRSPESGTEGSSNLLGRYLRRTHGQFPPAV